jgi:restriction system protein
MPIPSLFDLTLPVLRLAAQGEVSYAECIEQLAPEFQLTQEEREEMVPSGGQTLFGNRIRWAKVALGKAGLVENTQPKHFRATEQGRAVLARQPTRIDYRFLMQIDQYREAAEERSRRRAQARSGAVTPQIQLGAEVVAPEERIEAAWQEHTEALRQDLLDRLAAAPPAFFERVIVRLMLAMGYGGARPDAGRHLGRTGDGGVDGVIDGDPLGLDAVYVQAKRYQPGGSTVGRPDVQAFVGSLVGHSASKGVFVTTSTFAQTAREYAAAVPQRIVLIDGEELAGLMVRHGVGARVVRTIELKKLDEDFFSDEPV